MPGLAEKLVKEFENLQQAYPYETYGARVKKQADKLLSRSKRGQRSPGEAWDVSDTFSDDELRLILQDDDFSKQMLKAWEPSFAKKEPTAKDIANFRKHIFNTKNLDLVHSSAESDPYVFAIHNTAKEQRIKEAALAKIAKNQDFARKAELMLGQTSRLAPLSPLHTTAKEMLQRNNPDESLRLGREEIAAAGKTSVPREIDPYLKKASESPAAFLKQYEVDYAPIIANFRKEAAKDFLERDLPTINNQFAQKGAFYSGAREAALNKARSNKEQRIEQEISRLLMHGREEGMKHYHQHRTGHLKQAEIAGHAHQAEKDSRLRGAEALRVNSTTGQAALHQQAMALGQLARTEQQQAQNELNVRQQEHREEMERPFVQHARKAAIAQGTPIPTPQLSPESMNPPPPSVYGLGAGLIGHMGGLLGQQQMQQHAKGGHVRKGYAAGDSVSRAASQLQEMRNHIQESPEEAEMRESAQGFKNYRANPMADYLFAAGSHQLANLNGSPMKAYGEGAQLGMRAFKGAQAANLTAQEKYHNLMGKINQTKMDQHQFLAKYHSNIQAQEEAIRQRETHHGETFRHHKAMEDESRRTHDMMYASKLGNQAEINPNLPQFSSKEEEKSFWREQEAAKKEFRLQRKVIDKDINNFRHFKGLIEKGIGNTGPMIGWAPNALATLFDKPEIASNRFLAQKSLNEKVLELSGSMKGTQSDKDMAIIQGTVPSMSDPPLTFKKYLDKWEKISNRAEDEKKFIDKKMKQGFPITQAQEEWHEYVNNNPLFSEESEAPQSSEEGNVISMKDPYGNPLTVPEDDVEEVLRLGGTRAQ